MSKDYEEFIEKNITKSNEVIEKDIHVSIDISMYPNQEDFIPPIKGFIKEINKIVKIEVVRSGPVAISSLERNTEEKWEFITTEMQISI